MAKHLRPELFKTAARAPPHIGDAARASDPICSDPTYRRPPKRAGSVAPGPRAAWLSCGVACNQMAAVA
eukprot:1997908-Pyramimonas_sp.AAC.1